jgi:hypothetical protein
MYAGSLNLVHNPNARGRAPRYVVTENDGSVTKPKGVTTILGGTLSKDLMGWAVSCAINYLKERLPRITALDLDIAAVEYERLRDAGASTGSEAHALVEDFLKGREVRVAEASKQAQLAYGAFINWWAAQEDTEIVNVEEVIYSRQYQYAGTYDCLLKINGKNYLCDLKTTNASRKAPEGVYAEYFIQLGAYARAHMEERAHEIREKGSSKMVNIDGLMVISAKKDGKLHIKTNEDLGLSVDDCGDRFVDVVGISRFLAGTTAILGGK